MMTLIEFLMGLSPQQLTRTKNQVSFSDVPAEENATTVA